jgi:hypothetical protein
MATKKVIVRMGQAVPDIALQYYGSLNGMMDIAKLNSISITDKLTPGQQLIVSDITNPTVKYLADGKYIVAASDPETFTGIDYWTIEKDFIVQ